MQGASRVILSIVAIVIGLLLITNILPDTIKEATTEDYAEPFWVTTGVGENTTTEELSYDHYYGDLRDLSADSGNENDTPLVRSYNEDTRDVVVAGLQASASRWLTINYVREAHQEFTGFSAFVRLLPFILVIGLFVFGIFGIYTGVRNQ